MTTLTDRMGHLSLPAMSSSTERVVVAGAARGVVVEVVSFSESVKTAQQAADAIGCDVAAIVKSLVFLVDEEPVVALVPGDLRLDTTALAAAAGGSRVSRAPLDVVRDVTGFVAGGTPPFGHSTALRVFADSRLRRSDQVWAGAGTPQTVFSISISDLDRVSKPVWADIT